MATKDTKPKATAETEAPATVADHSSLNIYQKIAAITGRIGAISKGGTNRDQGYAFIEYAAVAGELRHLFSEYGVVVVPNMAKAADQKRDTFKTRKGADGTAALIDFEFKIVNADQPEDHFVVNWVGEATDYGDKATNKAATAALKYYLMRQFNVSEKGEKDADQETIERAGSAAPEPRHTPEYVNDTPAPAPVSNAITDDQKRALSAALTEKGITGDDQKRLLLKLSKSETVDKISKQNADVMLERIKGAEAEKLLEFLADTPIEEPIAETGEDAGEPAMAEETPIVISPKTAERVVDEDFKNAVTSSLDMLGLKPQERLSLLRKATGSMTPNNLSDDQWRAFSDAVDEKAIEIADAIVAGDETQNGGGNATNNETATE